MAWHWKPIEDIGGNFASAKSSPGVNLHEKCRTPHSGLTWIDCKIQKPISSLTYDCTDRRPTEESNAPSLLLFWVTLSIWKEVKGRRARTPNVFFVDTKTHYKPTETFQYTHFTSCHPPGEEGGGGVKRGFIIKKAKQEDCLEKTLKKTHLKSTSPRVFGGLWTTWPTGITPVAG